MDEMNIGTMVINEDEPVVVPKAKLVTLTSEYGVALAPRTSTAGVFTPKEESLDVAMSRFIESSDEDAFDVIVNDVVVLSVDGVRPTDGNIDLTKKYEFQVEGKGLSTNDLTDTLLKKLNDIEESSEKNVQSDWNVTDTTQDEFIKNKPVSMKNPNALTVQINGKEGQVYTGEVPVIVNITPTTVGAVPASHVGSVGTEHGVVTHLLDGFMSNQDKIKLDGIDEVVKSLVVDSLLSEDKTLALSANQGRVLKELTDTKVDKVAGKGLSTYDYDDTEKGKLALLVVADNLTTTTATSVLSANQGVVLKTELDKKLNSADYTASDVLTKVVEASGGASGSGINASKLNGVDGDKYFYAHPTKTPGQFDKLAGNPTTTGNVLNYEGEFHATKVITMWFTDYAEYRESVGEIIPGCIVTINKDGKFELSSRRLQPVARIVSDTYGTAIGMNEAYEHSVVIGLSGRALVYVDREITSGNIGCPICSGEDGVASIMTRDEVRLYPDRMVGVISSIPKTQTLKMADTEISVNNRVWVEIK